MYVIAGRALVELSCAADFVLWIFLKITCQRGYAPIVWKLGVYFFFPFGKFIIRRVRALCCSHAHAASQQGLINEGLPLLGSGNVAGSVRPPGGFAFCLYLMFAGMRELQRLDAY